MDEDRIETWPLPFGEEPELDFESDAFSIVLEPTEPGEEPKLEARGRNRTGVRVQVQREGRVTRVRAEYDPSQLFGFGFWGWNRHTVVALRVPASIRARVRTGAGKVRARDLRDCDVTLESEAGMIQAERLSGRIRLATAAGKIEGHELSGLLDAETNAGAIHLDVTALDPGTHRVRTDVGAVRLELAPGLAVRFESHTTMGSSRVDYPSTPNAPAVLELSSDVGSIRVREARGRYVSGAVVEGMGPYRTAQPAPATGAAAGLVATASVRDTSAEFERVLELVAQGKLSPQDASELLRALGHG